MDWIELGVPQPRSKKLGYEAVRWPEQQTTYLKEPLSSSCKTFVEVAQMRRSNRYFGEMTEGSLAELLWRTLKVKDSWLDQNGDTLSRSGVPSAGSLNPIHLLQTNNRSAFWSRYNPANHSVTELSISKSFNQIFESASQLVEIGDGTLLLLLAEPGKTECKYLNASSLVWRDAGILLGHLGLVAEALDLNFCCLGITGEPWASEFDLHNRLRGVGLAVVGSR